MLVVDYEDEIFGAKGYLVIDMLVNGVAGGGIRMRQGVTANDVTKLAQVMTLKFTLVEPNIGGAKCGIDYDYRRPDKLIVMQRFVDFIKPFLRTCYVTGADLNTNEDEVISCMRSVHIDCPQYALARRMGNEAKRVARFNTGIHLPLPGPGNIRLNAAATGHSIFAAAKAALPEQTTSGRTVAIQGFGNVGGSAAKFFFEDGATVVAVSDRDGVIYCRDGLDVNLLLSKRDDKYKLVFSNLLKDHDRPRNYEFFSNPDDILDVDAEIFVPAADSELITEKNYRRVKAKLISCGANDPFRPPDLEERFFEMGTLVIPDFIANAGTAILYHELIQGKAKLALDDLLGRIDQRVQTAVREALAVSKSEGISPRVAAERIAREKIDEYPSKYITTVTRRQ
jgi:glutamate dehydrogenase (NAD(P)+)